MQGVGYMYGMRWSPPSLCRMPGFFFPSLRKDLAFWKKGFVKMIKKEPVDIFGRH